MPSAGTFDAQAHTMDLIHRRLSFATVVATCLAIAATAEPAGQNVPASLQPPITIAFHSDPAPLRIGEGKFEVMLTDAKNKRVSDADVVLLFSQPTQTVKTLQVKSTVPLKYYGDGIYRGKGPVSSAGHWRVTAVVKRDGTQIASKTFIVTAE